MNTAVITIKTNPTLKTKAQSVAKKLGFSLSSVINAYLKHLVQTKTVHFSLSEEPSPFLIQKLKESREDIKAGRVVSFDEPRDALTYLDKLIKDEKTNKKS